MFGIKKCTKVSSRDNKTKVVSDFKNKESPTPAEIRQVRKVISYDPRDSH